MQTYSPREFFADWYKLVDLNPNETTLNNRISAIDKIVKINEDEFWLELLRIYLGMEAANQERRSQFITFFTDVDGAFPLTRNQSLLKLLATICLCINLTEEEENNEVISLGIVIGNFFFTPSINKKIPVLQYAEKYIFQTASKVREIDYEDEVPDLDIVEEQINASEAYSKEVTLGLIANLRKVVRSHLMIEEELNVLWWLFGQYSSISKKQFFEIDFYKMIFITAKEISLLSKFPFGFVSASSFINKAIMISTNGKKYPKEISLIDVLSSLSESEKLILLENTNSNLDFTPCIFLLKTYLDNKGNRKWEKNNEVALTKKVGPLDLSNQIYYEYLFIKHLNNG